MTNILALNSMAHHDLITLPIAANQTITTETLDLIDDATARILTTEEYLTILLKVDFASQEDRMSAYCTNELSDISAFLEGRKLHQDWSSKLVKSTDTELYLIFRNRLLASQKYHL